jgi:hypothetical protein
VGWLRDLILSSPRSIRGFDHLAKVCLESASWPSDLSIGHRSLGAMLGKLDREEGLDWLAARPGVQAELAKALGVERGLVQAPLAPGQQAEAGRLVQLAALPFAAGLDLLEEELFPGIPPEVLRPREWKRLVWVAPSGGGRTLVGRMLRARGLATVANLASWDETELPAKRPLYVELGDARGLDAATLGDGICVAVSSESSGRLPDGATLVRSPPVHDLLEPLVRWARARLTAASTWEPEAMVAALRGAVTSGVAQSAGDVLGLIGLADGVGLTVFTQRPLSRLAREWLRKRANERLDGGDPTTSWAKTSGYDGLVAWVQRAAVDSSEPLACARTPELWMALLPPELRRGADLEWLKVALVRAEPSLRKADVDRVSEAMPPGAFRILRAFEALGILERDGDDRVSLRPHWLVRVALDDALANIASGAAFDWGLALLTPRLAPVTLERLYQRAVAGDFEPEEIEADSATPDPVAAAAVEGAVRALGIAMLGAASAASDSPLVEPPETLWNAQLRLLVELDGLPRPRWDGAGPSKGFGGWLTTRGAWHLAMLSLGESFGAREGRPHPVLRPWQAVTAPPGLAAVLDSVASALDAPEAPRDIVGAGVALVARLRGVLGPLGAGGTIHRLERACVVADEAALGVLTFESVAALRGDAIGRIGLRHLLDVRRVLPESFAKAVFTAFDQAGQPTVGVELFAEPELAELLLPHAPARLLPALLPVLDRALSTTVASKLPMSDEQWSVLLATGADLPASLLAFLPERLAASAARAAGRSGNGTALQALWRRFPETLLALAKSALTPGGSDTHIDLEPLLQAIPKPLSARLIATLEGVDALLRLSAENLMALRRHLHRELRERDPGNEAFRELYVLFDELERRCARVTV